MRGNKKKDWMPDQVRMYGIITEEFCSMSWLEVARQLVGRVDILQLREKDLPDGELLMRARALKALTEDSSTLLVINDRPDIALLSGADGVHLGQDDCPAGDVLEMWGDRLIVGLSTHTMEEAREAEKTGVDYIGIGPVFPTDTKGLKTGNGLEYVTEISRSVNLLSVAIGGIKAHNAGKVRDAGAHSVAVLSGLCGSDDPAGAAVRLREAFMGCGA